MTTTDLVPYLSTEQSQGAHDETDDSQHDQMGDDRWPGKDGKLYRRKIVATMTLRRMTQREIAAQLGVSKTTVVKDQAWNRAQWQARNAEALDAHVAESLHVLDRTRAFDLTTMEDGSLPLAQRQAARDGIHANHDRRARLMGMDKPQKLEVSGSIDITAKKQRANELLDAVDELEARRRAG